jgi:hypothetical protein
MVPKWVTVSCKRALWSTTAALALAGAAHADEAADLKAQLAEQQKQIEELRKLVEQNTVQASATFPAAAAPVASVSEADVQRIVAGYLNDHPGAGMPPGVQLGYEGGKGFVIRSPNDPSYVQWPDQSRIPYELRIRGRFQFAYYNYQPTDSRNHLTGVDTGNNTSGTFSELELKRMRLIFEGTVYDPNFRYHIELDGSSRGLSALAGSVIPGTTGVANTGGGTVIGGTGAAPGIPGGNTVATTGPVMRLFQCYAAYDFHPWSGAACPDGAYAYRPTLTAIFGKVQPFMSFEEFLGTGNEQFVEYSSSQFFFDSDDNNQLIAAGFQVKACEDRFFMQALITNGNESNTSNFQMDDLPAFNMGLWYDFGSSWNPDVRRWDLYGDSASDIDYSTNPVVRVGAAMNIVPMDRRDEYSDAELNRVRIMSPAPGGTTLLGLLNGAGFNANSAGVGQYAVDAYDSYTYETFVAAKWRGASILMDAFFENIDNIRGRRAPEGVYPGNGKNQQILYTANTPQGKTYTALFPSGVGLDQYGFNLQGGYFLIPKKLEVVARWANIRGDDGSINGDGSRTALTAAQKTELGLGAVPGTIYQVGHAFGHESGSNEYAIGINYYFKRQLVKWQTDLSFYTGGNPALGGQPTAGYIPGVDGYLLRTQLQFAF